MTLEKLPKFEMYEEGSQIRRSSKTVKSAIAEGYGRREYAQDYLRYLVIAISSNDETTDHLETLHETKSLKDEELYNDLHSRLEILGKKLNVFIKSVRKRSMNSLSKNPEPRT
jgi:four helix bundle protein